MNLRNPVYTYNFQTSQPLTESQIEWLNYQLWDNLYADVVEDIPEWMTEIKLVHVEELID